MTDELSDTISICTECGKQVNDDTETKWNNDAEPYCRKCFRQYKINEALEHGCIFINHVAINDMGHEYRDENGEAIFDYK